jgi:prepilin-type N-terminal cleavage/methylation domain-containing protein
VKVRSHGGTSARAVLPTPDSAGFSLVEVIVASAVLGMLAASMGVFFMGGMRSSADLQHHQFATSLGAQAMELIAAVPAQADSSGCVPLLFGRSQSAVTAQWSAAPTGVDLTTSDPAWAGTSCPTTVAVPLAGLRTPVPDDGTPALTRSGTGYTVRTYIGTCRLPAAGGTCTRASLVPTGTTMYRVIVAVGWKGRTCAASACLHTVSTLVDPSTDPLFNLRSTTVPVAGADSVCTPAGAAVLVSLLGNDSGPLGASPVTIVSPPAHGSLSAQIVTGTGIYTPAAGFTGPDAFTYRLTSSSGAQSAAATVTVTVGGVC